MIEVQAAATFSDWLANLCDRTAAAIVAARILRVQKGLLGDVTPVGEGVRELASITARDTGFTSRSAGRN
jgi:putative addiction module killer protein